MMVARGNLLWNRNRFSGLGVRLLLPDILSFQGALQCICSPGELFFALFPPSIFAVAFENRSRFTP
jgi:hypothetical protein